MTVPKKGTSVLWDRIAVLAGKNLDVAYAGLVHQLGLTPGESMQDTRAIVSPLAINRASLVSLPSLCFWCCWELELWCSWCHLDMLQTASKQRHLPGAWTGLDELTRHSLLPYRLFHLWLG